MQIKHAVFALPMMIASLSQSQSLPARNESPFACNRLALNAEARKRHFDELGPALRTMHKSIRELPDGFEFGFPSDASSVQLVSEWAAGEHLCCPFFDIEMRFEREDGGFSMRLTGREGVKQFIRSDFSRWFQQ